MAVMKHFNYIYLFVRVLMEGPGEEENTVSFAMSFPILGTHLQAPEV